MRFLPHARAARSGLGVGLSLVVGCGHEATSTASSGPAPVVRVDAGHEATSDALADAAPSLAGDISERVRAAHARFGDAARVRTIGDTFVLVEAAPPRPALRQGRVARRARTPSALRQALHAPRSARRHRGQGKLWPFYHTWRDGYADDTTGEKAFARVMGMTPKAANAAWTRWAR